MSSLRLWDGRSREEWDEIWRLERLREDEMLAFRDQVGGRITNKALAEKFDLRPTRVGLLVRRHVEARARAALLAKIKRLEDGEQQLRTRGATFTAVAERLWMDLGWLATELEKRKKAAAAGQPQGSGE